MKKKVLAKYRETHDLGMITRTLGLKSAESGSEDADAAQKTGFRSVDWKYRFWKWGVICTDQVS